MLGQSVRDAEQAFANFFASVTGRRKGPRVGFPRFKSRHHHRQAVRFTRKGFREVRQTTRGVGFVTLSGIGRVRFVLSRPLPSDPSSVTLVLNADGTYEVSFVVEVDPPAPPVRTGPTRVAAIDAGLGDLAAVVYSDGTREKVANPRALRVHLRKLARQQRSLARKAKGSANRVKARVQVARTHAHVAAIRADHHTKLAQRLTATSDVIAVESLNLRGMGRTRLAKSIHDAGIGLLLEKITEHAENQGAQVIRIGQWEPTTQTCSVCGARGGRKPLHVRTWQCPTCLSVLDRDYNAAVNILVTAGQAETLNDCGGDVRRSLASADPDEAVTHRTDPAPRRAA